MTLRKIFLLAAGFLPFMPQTAASDFNHPSPEYLLGAILASAGFVTICTNLNPSKKIIDQVRKHCNPQNKSGFGLFLPRNPESHAQLRAGHRTTIIEKLELPEQELTIYLKSLYTATGFTSDSGLLFMHCSKWAEIKYPNGWRHVSEMPYLIADINAEFAEENFYQKLGIVSVLAGIGLLAHASSRCI